MKLSKSCLTARRYTKLLLLAVALCLTLFDANLSRTTQGQPQERAAEQVYRNIQVFKGLTSSQLLGAMNFMAGSLGVSCNHCHVPNQFAKDDKPAKHTARQHIQLMRSINDMNFGGQVVTTCVTCHRGETRPTATLAIPLTARTDRAPASRTALSLPTVDEVIERYLQAVGGRKRFEQLKSLKLTGTRETRNGADAPSIDRLEVYREAPNRLFMSFENSAGSSSQAFDGTIGWRQFNGRVAAITGADLLGAKRDADFYKDIHIKEQYANLTVVGKVRLAEREVFVIEATFPETHPAKSMFGVVSEKLYFDTQSGLLVRRAMEYRTPLGILPEATDYAEYRKVGGLMFPFTIRLSRPPLVVTQRLVNIDLNASINAGLFEMPAAK